MDAHRDGKEERDEKGRKGRMVPDDGIVAAAVGDGALLTFAHKSVERGKRDFRDECNVIFF